MQYVGTAIIVSVKGPLSLIGKLLVDCPYLLLNIDVLQVADVSLTFAFGVAIKTVHGQLFSPSLLIFGKRQTSDSVKDIAPLTGQTLEIIRHIIHG